MGGKNVAVVIVLAVVFIAALVITLKRTGLLGGQPPPPESAQEQKLTKIEMKSPFKRVTLSYREWRKLGPDAAGRFQDPESKEYTLVDPMMCASCREMIPTAQYPPEILALPPDKQEEAKVNFRNEYKCPKCGKPAFVHEIP